MTRAVLTDIEGTTSSLSFVKDVLFPYSRAHLSEFVRAHKHEPDIQRLLNDTRAAAGAPLDDAAVVIQLLQWIDEDKKVTPLKALQGLIWEAGYRQRDFTGHIYDDALTALRDWRKRGLHLYIFSSGSVKAQQLLFGHTDHGDLTPLFDGYFDTTIGAKREPSAYERIAVTIGLPSSDILFLSDIKEELDAARTAGYKTYWIVRSGEAAGAGDHPIARRFDEIRL
ncbi:MAG: acireductone synthase [Gammaproteobacteria bacterium]|nr:acireductone synthase [Gammaproteobacteria bacterium]